jgi:hypothetical protein
VIIALLRPLGFPNPNVPAAITSVHRASAPFLGPYQSCHLYCTGAKVIVQIAVFLFVRTPIVARICIALVGDTVTVR